VITLSTIPKPAKVGLDDYLVAHGADGLYRLLAEAIEPEDVSSVEMKAPAAELDPASETAGYIKTGERDGVSRLRHHCGGFKLWRAGRYVELPTSERGASSFRKSSQSVLLQVDDQRCQQLP
jgi:hypothetical protein